MQIKLYLPIFFLLIFSGKILVLDSALQFLAPESPEYSIQKPLCEKRWSKRSPQTSSLQQEKTATNLLIIQNICHQNFWFEKTPETEIIFIPNYREYQYYSPSVLEIYIPNIYPPPKLLQTV
ncbi:hypothetical protein ACFQ3Q_07675 [Salegentibacter chungangensis]|uniref:DUF3298 domain-containing protein n=1 Tax=Salegentibacter chungangensis TaxID=1335724 RepID=A0ABW3NS73_9FLAO